jgi:TPR repeat protein
MSSEWTGSPPAGASAGAGPQSREHTSDERQATSAPPAPPDTAVPALGPLARAPGPEPQTGSLAEQRPENLSRPAVTPLLARADALIAIGDIAAARLVYQRAVTLGSGRAATAMGKTYDPGFLRQIGAVGVLADPDLAAAWYRKGAALGNGNAAPLVAGTLKAETGQ